MKTIEREHFEAWLFNQPEDRKFDYTQASNCAICAFLRETTSVKNPIVDAKTISSESSSFPTPKWLDDGYDENGKSRGDVRGVVRVWPLTIANMRRRYLELFPETQIEVTKAPPEQAALQPDNPQPSLTRTSSLAQENPQA